VLISHALPCADQAAKPQAAVGARSLRLTVLLHPRSAPPSWLSHQTTAADHTSLSRCDHRRGDPLYLTLERQPMQLVVEGRRLDGICYDGHRWSAFQPCSRGTRMTGSPRPSFFCVSPRIAAVSRRCSSGSAFDGKTVDPLRLLTQRNFGFGTIAITRVGLPFRLVVHSAGLSRQQQATCRSRSCAVLRGRALPQLI